MAGSSDSAVAWTDGSSFIALERSYLATASRSIHGWADLVSTIAHEYAHVDSSRNHDAEFYERFHELLTPALAELGNAYVNFMRACKRKKLDIGNTAVYHLDLIESSECLKHGEPVEGSAFVEEATPEAATAFVVAEGEAVKADGEGEAA
jgi:hypothetical protein